MKQPQNKITEWNTIASWWDKEAANQGIYHQHTDIDPILWKMIGPIRGKKVIEIGCGNGYFSRRLAKKGAHVTAIDASIKMISFARERQAKYPLGINYLKRDAVHLAGIKAQSFDLAVANMSVMDIVHIEQAIKETARVLKPSGRFIFSMVHPAFMFEGTWERVWGKKRFGRIVWRYLRPYVWVMKWGKSRHASKNYTRPLQFYVDALRKARFVVTDFREIATKKPIVKAGKKDKNVLRRLSRYTTVAQKKEKLRARSEIPCFVIIGVQKIG